MKKKYILIIFLIFIYICTSLYFVFMKKENAIFLGDSTKVIVKNGDIKVYKDNSLTNLIDAKIYFNNEFIDGYIKTIKNDIVDYNTREALTKKQKSIIFSNGLLAYTGKANIKVGNPNIYNVLTNTEKEVLTNIAYENDIEGSLTDSKRVDFDIDNDNKEESIYSFKVISETKLSTLVVLFDDGESEVIDINSGESKYPSVKQSWFSRFIDFDGDDKYEIVLFQSNGDDSLGEYKIYYYQNGTAVQIK